MTKLDEMWDKFEQYQSIADDEGHGKTWAEMCRLRTVEACRAASNAAAFAAAAADAAKYAADAAAANYAAYAAYAATADAASNAAAEYWMQEAIKRINHAIKLAEKQK
jgi:hypothetical protein